MKTNPHSSFSHSPAQAESQPQYQAKGSKIIKHISSGMFVAALMAATAFAQAQQITGTLGSPSATTTIDGKQLPSPDPKFGGVIKDVAADSKPYWPPTVVPPKGAPNVLLIMTDDQGYGV